MMNRFICAAVAWLCGLLMLCGCSGSESRVAGDYIAVQLVDSLTIGESATDLQALKINGNIALAFNRADSGFVECLNYPEFSHVKSYGKKGRGPGEWVTTMCGSSDIANEMLVYDMMNMVVGSITYADSTFAAAFDSLPHQDGMAPPYGNIAKVESYPFIAQENNRDGSRLVVVDFATGIKSGEYICDIAVDNSNSIKGYPFDDFYFAANPESVFISYLYADKSVLLSNSEGKLTVVKTFGSQNSIDASSGLPDRKYAIQVAERDGVFYTLCSDDNSYIGTVIRRYDAKEKSELPPLKLSRPVKLIAFDYDGLLIGVAERENDNIAYRFKI